MKSITRCLQTTVVAAQFIIFTPLRHWHRPFARESINTSDFVCKPLDKDVPLVEIELEEEDDYQQWTLEADHRPGFLADNH